MTPMKSLLPLIVLIITLTAPAAMAQRTTRRHLKPRITAVTPTDSTTTIVPGAGDFSINGFDKPMGSTKETFHFTNNLPSTITKVFLTITYLDTARRQLHKASRSFNASLPPGETTLVTLPSFDRQNSFYYHLSRKPRTQATPFDVVITVDSINVIGYSAGSL